MTDGTLCTSLFYSTAYERQIGSYENIPGGYKQCAGVVSLVQKAGLISDYVRKWDMKV